MSKTDNTHQIYKRLLSYAKPYWWRLALGIFFAAVAGGSLAGALLGMEQLLAKLFGEAAVDQVKVKHLAIFVPAVMILQGICIYFAVILVSWVGYRVVTDIREESFRHLQRLSSSFYAGSKSGDLLSRVTNDTTQVQQAVSSTMIDLVKEPFVLIGALSAVVYKLSEANAMGASWSLLVLPLCIIPVIILGRKIRKYAKQNQQHLAGLVSVIQENISGQRIVKSHVAEHFEEDKFDKENKRVFSRLMRIIQARALNQPLMQIVASITIVFVLFSARDLDIKLSEFIVIIGGVMLAYQPVKRLGRIQMVLEQSAASAQRIFEILDEKPTIVDKADAVSLEAPITSVNFENLSFSYGEGDVIKNFNLDVPAGKCIAIVGDSGSGKSTLVSLIMRLYDPTQGAIKINGVDLRDFKMTSLRGHIAEVNQDTFLFNDSVAANIAYGVENPAQEKIEEAARRAHAHEFIEELPETYQTTVGDRGLRLSGGQKQRLAIARALFRDAPILILDEATSALDNESERLVQEAINELMEGRTVFAIAHRLSTIQHADEIIVMKEGEIVERGKHDELLTQGGHYKYLYELQFS